MSTAPSSAPQSGPPALAIVLGLTGVIIFAGTLPATRIGVEVFDPGFLTFARAAAAGILATATLLVMKRKFPFHHWTALTFAGVTLVFGFPGFMALAMVTVPSAHGGVVLGILPLTTAIFAALWAGERPSALFWICGIAGAVLVIIYTLRAGGGKTGTEVGDLWLLLAAVTASAGYVVSGKLSAHLPGWEVICWALVLMLPASLFATWWLADPASFVAAETSHWLSFGYVSLFSMFLGFFAWNTGLRMGGLSRIGQLQLLQTFFTLAIAAALLGEAVTFETVLFAVAVLAMVLLGRRARIGQKSVGQK
ncbi:DMT family transporter [Ahrensia sp. R2A130]|uniref:DMT family transporter n=1 Tax=Ahrensia sp. R2A130 TaxID=744979 RepID=UPI0001E0D0B6|nr:DMT family transporter [Ahrensia sp. R2A130]EFL90855.1 integral membrane protein [Ahrensia sp. R2A130]